MREARKHWAAGKSFVVGTYDLKEDNGKAELVEKPEDPAA